MDTTDKDIIFYGRMGCNHCISLRENLGKTWFNDNSGMDKLEDLINKIKFAGKDSKYDCILGLSGGLDSSYLALKAYQWGLRPLVLHVDGGWNTETAVKNIQSVLEYTKWDLETIVIDWLEMRNLQIAFLAAGVANQDTPQDHAFFSSLYSFASKNCVKYILSGGNNATEGILPASWQGPAMDARNLLSIYSSSNQEKLIYYPTTSFFSYYVKYPFVQKIQPVRPLNLIPYRKDDALIELEKEVGYIRYPRKHGESTFTKFFQEFYLPTKFGIDKRIPHLSSQIVSGQTEREQAVAELEIPLYTNAELERDIDFISRKLNVSISNFKEFLVTRNRSYKEFDNWDLNYKILKVGQKSLQLILRKTISYYS